MKRTILILLTLMLAACAKDSGSGSSAASAQATSTSTLEGVWNKTSSRVDIRLGRIYTSSKYVFIANGDYTVTSYAYYESISKTFTREETGHYMITGNQIDMIPQSATCPIDRPVTMNFAFGGPTLQLSWTNEVGSYSIDLGIAGFLAFGTQTLDYGCSNFR